MEFFVTLLVALLLIVGGVGISILFALKWAKTNENRNGPKHW